MSEHGIRTRLIPMLTNSVHANNILCNLKISVTRVLRLLKPLASYQDIKSSLQVSPWVLIYFCSFGGLLLFFFLSLQIYCDIINLPGKLVLNVPLQNIFKTTGTILGLIMILCLTTADKEQSTRLKMFPGQIEVSKKHPGQIPKHLSWLFS